MKSKYTLPICQKNIKRFNFIIDIKSIELFEKINGKYHKLSHPYIIHDPPIVQQGLYKMYFLHKSFSEHEVKNPSALENTRKIYTI